MRRLARILWDGTSGAGVDRRNAVAWWEKAAKEGDTTSMIILGDMHARGLYFRKSTSRARALYEMAEQAGSKTARSRLRALQNETNEAPPALRDPFEHSSDDTDADEDAPMASAAAQAPHEEQNDAARSDEGEDSLSSRIARLSNNMRAEDTTVEVECEVPQELMERYLELCFRAHNGDEKKIKRSMEAAALLGFVTYIRPDTKWRTSVSPEVNWKGEYGTYEGPWSIAARQFNKKFMIHGEGEEIAQVGGGKWIYTCSDEELRSATGVCNTCGLAPKLKHSSYVEWKNGLPVRARVILDGSPEKGRLLLRPRTEDE